MSCQICGRNNCSRMFHSLEDQNEHDEKFGEYEDKIYDLKERIAELKFNFGLVWDELTYEQRDNIESKLK